MTQERKRHYFSAYVSVHCAQDASPEAAVERLRAAVVETFPPEYEQSDIDVELVEFAWR